MAEPTSATVTLLFPDVEDSTRLGFNAWASATCLCWGASADIAGLRTLQCVVGWGFTLVSLRERVTTTWGWTRSASVRRWTRWTGDHSAMISGLFRSSACWRRRSGHEKARYSTAVDASGRRLFRRLLC